MVRGMKSSGRNYGTRTTGSSRGGWGKTTTSKTARRTTTTTPRGYNDLYNTFQNRVQSYRTLWDQTKGATGKNRPTPATLKTFAGWINKGANVWKVSKTQVNKWCKTSQTYKTNTAVKAALGSQFGKTTIKAVTYAKNGGYLVATAPTWKGKPFKFPR